MITKQLVSPRTAILCAILITISTGGPARAGFQYASSTGRDLVLGFRQTGGSSELVVNVGAVSNLYSLANGTTITITNLTAGLLSAAFSGLNALSWSASADVRVSGDASYPVQTLWVTRARSDLNTQTAAWVRQSSLTQGTVGGKISGLGDNAVTYGNQVPTGANNTATEIVIPSGSVYGYSQFIGPSGNFASTFQGNVETTTPANFATAGQSVRADFYQLIPGSGAGTYLGYFEFNPNGVLTYTMGPSSTVIPAPTITGITRSGSTNTISFTTVTNGQYSLRYTNSAGLTTVLTNWPASGSPVAGNGTTNSVKDVTSDPQRFYRILVTP